MNKGNFEATMIIDVSVDTKLGYGYDNESNQSLVRPYVDLGEYREIGILIPTIDTSILYLKVSNSIEVASFKRLQKTDGSGDWNVASGTGAKAIALNCPFRYLRVECASTQTADRTFTISGKPQ
jgi:hypothetical protein